jgi:hypothetical protein
VSKPKEPVTPAGNPRLGGELQAFNRSTEQWDDCKIRMVLDMRNGRGQTYKAVVLEGEDAEGRWHTEPTPWHEITWRRRAVLR